MRTSTQAKVTLRQYMRAGGGFVAIHNAFGTEYNWPWYEGLLGNANYYDHGSFQNGIDQHRRQEPTRPPPACRRSCRFKDEWYNLVPYPTQREVPRHGGRELRWRPRSTVHPGHGNFHPVAWCQYYDGGRAWLTTLGHDAQAFTDGIGFPGQAAVQAADRERHQIGDGQQALLQLTRR